jgi:methylthioribose-1-phosphate isomerase
MPGVTAGNRDFLSLKLKLPVVVVFNRGSARSRAASGRAVAKWSSPRSRGYDRDGGASLYITKAIIGGRTDELLDPGGTMRPRCSLERAKLSNDETDQGRTMKIAGTHYRTIWVTESGTVRVIDQSRLPFEFATSDLETFADAARAIKTMVVRGAPLIGATAAYGVALAARADPSDSHLAEATRDLQATRPTAINLVWALTRMRKVLAEVLPRERADVAFREAAAICDADVEQCRSIGVHGLEIVRGLAESAGRTLNILTHCNAGWLACVDWGTALAPLYMAHDAGIPVHVWVDETRPRNQGAALTAFELGAHGVPHTVIADNLGGHLMQRARVDMVIVGSDRTTAGGDVCNKVGTYLKALAAKDNAVPFYAALPVSTIDWSIHAGSAVPIEERSAEEVTHISGRSSSGRIETVRLVPERSPALNLAFDVTPARLVTGLITERGVCSASRAGLQRLYPDARAAE